MQALEHLSNAFVDIAFNPLNGALVSLRNRQSGQEILSMPGSFKGPFALYYDLFRAYDQIGSTTSFRRPRTAPAELARRVLRPGRGVHATLEHRENAVEQALKLMYQTAHSPWRAELTVTLPADTPSSRWALSVTNIGAEPATLMGVFPFIGGLRLGNGRANRMVVNDQAGYIARLWSARGGVYGDSAQMSMQWGCAFDDDPAGTHDAFGFIVRDAAIRNKEIIYQRPSIQVRYFPPQTLQPGETLTFPEAELLVYCGDWKRTAQAYHAWFCQAFPRPPIPAWAQRLDSYVGQWFWRRGQEFPPEYQSASGLIDPLDSFHDLPQIYLHKGVETIEFAFLGRGCMGEKASGRIMAHTDGDNIVREDLGGAEGLREGVARVHRMGLRCKLYVEGYICPKDSDVVKQGGDAWAVMNQDGTNLGPYTREGKWLHMCPGAKGWQEHLAQVAARLVRETDVDGIRLDSLGFYAFPCYNPAHQHASPWDYNAWVRELLHKVADAVHQVKPEAFLTTEAGVDFFYQFFDGALTQQWNPTVVSVSRDVAPMRVAVPEYGTIVYNACGPVAASLMGFPGGSGGRSVDDYFLDLDRRWRSARFPVAQVVRWGDAAHDNPVASRPDVVCRRFSAEGLDVVVGARPRLATDFPPNASPLGFYRNSNVDTKRSKVSFEVRVDTEARLPRRVYLTDVHSLALREAPFRQEGGQTVVSVDANWFVLVLASEATPPLAMMTAPSTLAPGEAGELRFVFAGDGQSSPRPGTLVAPGLGHPATPVQVPGTLALHVPAEALPGWYALRLEGPDFLGCQRFIRVRSSPKEKV